MRTRELHLDKRRLGDASLVAKTSGTALSFHLDSDNRSESNSWRGADATYQQLFHASQLDIHEHPLCQHRSVRFQDSAIKPAFDALVEGKASLNGPLARSRQSECAGCSSIIWTFGPIHRAPRPVDRPPERLNFKTMDR